MRKLAKSTKSIKKLRELSENKEWIIRAEVALNSHATEDTLLKLCNAYKITPDIILYDLLDDEIKNSISIYDEKFKKLSKRDKESILYFIDYFLEK